MLRFISRSIGLTNLWSWHSGLKSLVYSGGCNLRDVNPWANLLVIAKLHDSGPPERILVVRICFANAPTSIDWQSKPQAFFPSNRLSMRSLNAVANCLARPCLLLSISSRVKVNRAGPAICRRG